MMPCIRKKPDAVRDAVCLVPSLPIYSACCVYLCIISEFMSEAPIVSCQVHVHDSSNNNIACTRQLSNPSPYNHLVSCPVPSDMSLSIQNALIVHNQVQIHKDQHTAKQREPHTLHLLQCTCSPVLSEHLPVQMQPSLLIVMLWLRP